MCSSDLRMVRNLIADELRKKQAHGKYVTLSDDINYHERWASPSDQFNDLSLKYSAEELLKVLPRFEALVFRLLLQPSEEFKAFWFKRHKIHEFLMHRGDRRFVVVEPMDLDEDMALAEFLMITPARYRESVARIRRVAGILLARQQVLFDSFNRSQKREQRKNMQNTSVEAKPAYQDSDLYCFGVYYEPLVQACRGCQSRFLCKAKVAENMHSKGPDEFQREFVRISGINAMDTSATVLQLQEIFMANGLEVVNNTQTVTAKVKGKNVFLISRKKSRELRNLVKFIQVKNPVSLPSDIQPFLELTSDKKTWTCNAQTMDKFKEVLATYLKFYRDTI